MEWRGVDLFVTALYLSASTSGLGCDPFEDHNYAGNSSECFGTSFHSTNRLNSLS